MSLKINFQSIKIVITILFSTLLLSACTLTKQIRNNYFSSDGSEYRIYPYLQNPTSAGISILWFSESNNTGTLSYRIKGSEVSNETISESKEMASLAYSTWASNTFFNGNAPAAPFQQRVRIENLEPATTYQYTVIQDNESFSSSFRTAPEGNANIRVIVYGDSETEPESTGVKSRWKVPVRQLSNLNNSENTGKRHYLIDQTQGYKNNLTEIKSRNPDFILIAGDLVQSGGEQRDWDEFWRQNNSEELRLASSVPVMPTFGNHEYYAGPKLGYSTQPASEKSVQKYLNYFEVPANNAPNKKHEERYYSFTYGPATFVILDVTNNAPEDSTSDTSFYLNGSLNRKTNKFLRSFSPGFSPKTRQYRWLENTLKKAQKTSQFIFISLHHSPYSSGPHGRPAGDTKETDKQSGVPVRALTPLFMKYGVDAVLSGHDEMWERSEVVGEKVLISGIKKPHSIQFYDVGIGGDGLRRPRIGNVNPFQKFIANDDAPEQWENGELVSGGRHYGHLELDINLNKENKWQAIFKPIYLLPVKDEKGNYTKYLRKSYDDELTIVKTKAD